MADSNGQTSSGSQTTSVKTDPRQPYATVKLSKINGRWECEFGYEVNATSPISERDLRIIERTLVTSYRAHIRGFRQKVILAQHVQNKIKPGVKAVVKLTGNESIERIMD